MADFGISPNEYRARVNRGHEIVAQFRQSLQSIQDSATNMIGNSWRGNAPSYAGQQLQGTHEAFHPILMTMEHALTTAGRHAGIFQQLDEEV